MNMPSTPSGTESGTSDNYLPLQEVVLKLRICLDTLLPDHLKHDPQGLQKHCMKLFIDTNARFYICYNRITKYYI